MRPSHGRSDSNLREVINLIIRASAEYGYISQEGELEYHVDHWCDLLTLMKPGPNAWIKLVKHKICAFYASAQSVDGDLQELPVPPAGLEADKPQFLLGGRWSRWFKRMRARSSHFQSLLCTILQGVKKGCPRASELGLREATLETVDQLTGPLPEPKRVPSLRAKSGLPVEDIDILSDCRRTVRELFARKKFKIADFVGGFPSTSSTYYKSRKQYGAVSEIAQHLEDIIHSNEIPLDWDPAERIFDPGARYLYNKSLDTYDDTEYNEIIPSVVVNSKQLGHFQDFRLKVTKRLLERAFEEVPAVEPVSLPEALKVRVITKGPALMGYVLAPLQRFLHTTLRQHPVFQLIGMPISEQILLRNLGALPKGQKWLSGDYKDATNGLLSSVSNTICDEICSCIFDRSDFDGLTEVKLRVLFRRALTGHLIQDLDGNLRPQTNGQLMGSIVSFPVLCIANAALCRRVIEESLGFRVNLKECQLLINGDDCVFPTNHEGFKMWKDLCHAYNMKPSVGKTYFSDRFLNINSTTYLTTPTTEMWEESEVEADGETLAYKVPYRFQEVKYINYGLVLHKKRSGGIMGTESVFDRFCNFGENSKELLRTLPEFCKDSVYTQYIQEFGRIAKTCNIKIPWFVPQKYGGVGIVPYGTRKLNEAKARGPSRRDRRVCSLLKKDNITFPLFTKDQKWSIHRNVQPLFACSELSEDPTEYDKYYGIAVASIFFSAVLTRKYELIYGTGPQVETVKLLRRAERIWAKCLPKTDSREIDPWELTPQLFPMFTLT